MSSKMMNYNYNMYLIVFVLLVYKLGFCFKGVPLGKSRKLSSFVEFSIVRLVSIFLLAKEPVIKDERK